MSSAPTVRNTAASSQSSANKDATTVTTKSEMISDTSSVENKGGDSNSKPGTSKMEAMTNQFLKKYPILAKWKSRRAFVTAQYQVFGILAVAYIVNNWPISYPREENHNEGLFWAMVAGLGVAAFYTMKHEPGTRGVQLLSRDQTEEWKGWMQFVFIMVRSFVRLIE